MNIKKILIFATVFAGVIGATVVVANVINQRVAVAFFIGHTHDENGTHGAPSHSGGTNSAGCHNGSVPYHCH